MQNATSNFHVRPMKKLLFIISTPPYSAKRGTALLDAAMVAAAFDAEVSLMFRGDGVWSLHVRAFHPKAPEKARVHSYPSLRRMICAFTSQDMTHSGGIRVSHNV